MNILVERWVMDNGVLGGGLFVLLCVDMDGRNLAIMGDE